MNTTPSGMASSWRAASSTTPRRVPTCVMLIIVYANSLVCQFPFRSDELNQFFLRFIGPFSVEIVLFNHFFHEPSIFVTVFPWIITREHPNL